MGKRKNHNAKVRFVKSTVRPIAKATTATNLDNAKDNARAGLDEVIPSPYPLRELQKLKEMSTILQQCINAYKRNIVGFGLTPAYIEDDLQETSAMKAEWDAMKDVIQYFSFDESFEDLLGSIIEDREETGNGYLEVIRDGKGLPAGGERVEPVSMGITKEDDQLVPVDYVRGGKTFTRYRRFRKYVQTVDEQKVFFKEFGDPRKMDRRNGKYVDTIEIENEANEILHFKIGSGTYGIPRWIGQLIHMYGARKAEELNFRYFTQGRHTPMAILLHNAILSEDSEQALVDYANSVEGVDNSHKFLIIEAEGIEQGLAVDDKNAPAKVEVKSLADMLQQDALFLEYDDASREKVQSAFGLPDIYVGRTKDFNRATADAARANTEEQVFEPMRNTIEWVLTNKLFAPYQFQHVKAQFNKPEITSADDVAKILLAANEIGGVAPNDVRELVGKTLGKTLEPFKDPKYDEPMAAVNAQATRDAQAEAAKTAADARNTGGTAFQKSDGTDTIAGVLKEVRDVLEEQYELIGRVYNESG